MKGRNLVRSFFLTFSGFVCSGMYVAGWLDLGIPVLGTGFYFFCREFLSPLNGIEWNLRLGLVLCFVSFRVGISKTTWGFFYMVSFQWYMFRHGMDDWKAFWSSGFVSPYLIDSLGVSIGLELIEGCFFTKSCLSSTWSQYLILWVGYGWSGHRTPVLIIIGVCLDRIMDCLKSKIINICPLRLIGFYPNGVKSIKEAAHLLQNELRHSSQLIAHIFMRILSLGILVPFKIPDFDLNFRVQYKISLHLPKHQRGVNTWCDWPTIFKFSILFPFFLRY